MELKPIRRIPSQNLEILAETSEVVLCKRNFNDGYTLRNNEYVAQGSNYEYVTWLKCKGTKDSFTLGHYFNHDLEGAFKDFLHRASRGINRDYVAVPKQSLKFFIEKTVDELNNQEQFEVLYEEEVEELNDTIEILTQSFGYKEEEVPHIKNEDRRILNGEY